MVNTFLYANNAKSALAGSITNVATAATLTSGSGVLFPNPATGQQFALTFVDAATGLLNEIVYVTGRSGDNITMVRAQEGTTGLAWSAGDIAASLFTAGNASQMLQPGNTTYLRTRLAANATFYVATTGNDSTGDGSSGNPWATIQHAYNYVAANLDVNGFQAVIQLADGTYAPVQINKTLVGIGAFGSTAPSLVIQGNAGTPSNVVINDSGSVTAVLISNYCQLYLQNLKVQSTSAAGVLVTNGVVWGKNVVYGVCGTFHIQAEAAGQYVIDGNYSIVGGARSHFSSAHNALISAASNWVCTLTGTPAFSTAFASSAYCGVLDILSTAGALTFSGAATGSRYSATLNSVIAGTGGVTTYFPGSTAGTFASGGQYA